MEWTQWVLSLQQPSVSITTRTLSLFEEHCQYLFVIFQLIKWEHMFRVFVYYDGLEYDDLLLKMKNSQFRLLPYFDKLTSVHM